MKKPVPGEKFHNEWQQWKAGHIGRDEYVPRLPEHAWSAEHEPLDGKNGSSFHAFVDGFHPPHFRL